jgi:hypothetical protein
MQILCNVKRERFTDTDRAGRPYTMELVHYMNANTGERVLTKGYIVPTARVRAQTAPVAAPIRRRNIGKTPTFRSRVSRAAQHVFQQFF